MKSTTRKLKARLVEMRDFESLGCLRHAIIQVVYTEAFSGWISSENWYILWQIACAFDFLSADTFQTKSRMSPRFARESRFVLMYIRLSCIANSLTVLKRGQRMLTDITTLYKCLLCNHSLHIRTSYTESESSTANNISAEDDG